MDKQHGNMDMEHGHRHATITLEIYISDIQVMNNILAFKSYDTE
jgi:hypothetical protein